MDGGDVGCGFGNGDFVKSLQLQMTIEKFVENLSKLTKSESKDESFVFGFGKDMFTVQICRVEPLNK